MAIIEFLQQFSHPVLKVIMRIISEFGNDIFFIVLGSVLFWLVDKKFALRLMIVFLFSAVLNGGLKDLIKSPRPYDEGAESFEPETPGYSMPSGHSQNIAVTSTMMIHNYAKIKWLKYIFIALAVLVPFSRMYLGQHYLEDVLAGLIIGFALAIGLIVIFEKFPNNEDYIGLILAPIVLVFMIIFNNEQIYVAGGAYLGLIGGYYFEKRYVNYEIKAPFWIQILKVVIGLGVAFGIKEGVKPLLKLIGDYLFLDSIRYFLIALWASLGAPALFKAIFKEKKEPAID